MKSKEELQAERLKIKLNILLEKMDADLERINRSLKRQGIFLHIMFISMTLIVLVAYVAWHRLALSINRPEEGLITVGFTMGVTRMILDYIRFIQGEREYDRKTKEFKKRREEFLKKEEIEEDSENLLN